MTKTRQRIAKVFDYIERNLDQKLDSEILAKVAGISKYHFHRQFSHIVGLSLHKYVQLHRLKRASYQLSFREQFNVTDVALDAGFENSESFSRAFKQVFKQTPSEFKQQADWSNWQQQLVALNNIPNELKVAAMTTEQINIIDFPETPIAVLEHIGSPHRIFESVQKFIAWRKKIGLSPAISQTYNLLYQDPLNVPDSEFQLDICASTDKPIDDNDEGIVNKVIPAGRCAVLRHFGNDHQLGTTIGQLLDWLEQSDEVLRDFPLFLHRVTLFPDVNESQMITDVYLPIK